MSTPDTQLRPTGPRQDDQPGSLVTDPDLEDPNEPPAATFSEPTREPQDPDGVDTSLDGSVWWNAFQAVSLAATACLLLTLLILPAPTGMLGPHLLIVLAPLLVVGGAWILNKAWRWDR